MITPTSRFGVRRIPQVLKESPIGFSTVREEVSVQALQRGSVEGAGAETANGGRQSFGQERDQHGW